MFQFFSLTVFLIFVLTNRGVNASCEPQRDANGKIIGGEDACEGEFPYQAAIVKTTGSLWCGATIINANFLLSVAYCHSRSTRSLRIVAGALNIQHLEGTWQVRQISKFIKHPDYDSNTASNNIALIYVKAAFVWHDYVQPIPVSTDIDYPVGDATATGWGTINSDDYFFPAVLQKVTVAIVDYDTCLEQYGTLPENSICAASEGKDSCEGDDGGPLVLDGELIGLTSYGIGCADPNYPGVYTFVPLFKSWIQETMLKLTPKLGITTEN